MSRESYVKFETAQLLKEKGFDWECTSYWCVFPNGDTVHTDVGNLANHNGNESNKFISRPTQQMACKWLREEHNILVTVAPCEVGAGVDDYTYVIHEIQPEDYHFKFIAQGRMQPVTYTMDYEGTLEEGIKHVLTNLI